MACLPTTRFVCVALILSFSTLATAAPPEGYQLHWADEFDGSQLDESAWWYRADVKHQSVQLPENVEIVDGNLQLNLTLLPTPIQGRDAAGAGIISQQQFRYGYYEVRSQLGDGINDDNDGEVDEGWHHAFWAMWANGDANGHVNTTFPPERRTEIDAYENGSGNLARMTQHVLHWNESGNIIARLPANDVTTLPQNEINDWHTYGFEWTPDEVRFFVNDQLTKVADYRHDEWEHTDVNVWLTAISTNWESSDQEVSRARYDYFRFYEPGDILVPNGSVRQIGRPTDIGAPVGGTITTSSFGRGAGSSGGIAGHVIVESGGMVEGAGTVWGDLTAQAGATIRVAGGLTGNPGSPVITSEDFESFTPGDAYANGSSTSLLPTWTFYDLGKNNTDAIFSVSGADASTNQPSDPALVGESQMLFQRATGLDFANDPNGQPYAGAVAITDRIDTSGAVDIIEADFALDGYGDNSGRFLDSKIAFGFRDIDNWYSLSVVRGQSDGSNTQIDVIANVDGQRNNVFASQGTSSFNGNFPEDTLLSAKIVHDANEGFVSFAISNKATGVVLAEAFVVDDVFKEDGLVGFGVNNDATGWDNFVVTTQDFRPFQTVQTLTIDGDLLMESGSRLEIDIQSAAVHDELEVVEAANLAGELMLTLVPSHELQPYESLEVLVGDQVIERFDTVSGSVIDNQLGLAVGYHVGSVTATLALLGDANLDGVVDGQDFIVWNDNKFRTGTSWSEGDFNGDGVTDGQDFVFWNDNKFTSLPVNQVPEPLHGIWMLLLALTGRVRVAIPGQHR